MIYRTLACLAALGLAAPALAQDFGDQLKARQGQFRILAINLGIIGDMAKGETEYDAEMATMAAESLKAVSGVHQRPLWPEGSSEMGMDGTRAKAEIWDNWDDFTSKWSDLGTATDGVVAVAGDGREALGPALGELGNTCKACHDDYRAPRN